MRIDSRHIVAPAALLAVLAGFGSAAAAPRDHGPIEFLRTRLGLNDGELQRAQRGEAVVRMVRRPGDRELAVVGVIAADPVAHPWSADFSSLERLRRTNPDVLGIGRLGIPAVAADLAAVEIEKRILSKLDACRLRSCAMNLPAAAIEHLAGWGDYDAGFRELLRTLAIQYQERGDAALPDIASRPIALSTADAAAPLLTRPPSLAQIAPPLAEHFGAWPAGGNEARDLFYWVREKSWKHEVVSLVHAAFSEESLATARVYVLAEKTFYANHYLRGALSITGLVEDGSEAYLFHVNRNETDNGSSFNFIERALAGYLIPRRLSRQIVALRSSLPTRRAGDSQGAK